MKSKKASDIGPVVVLHEHLRPSGVAKSEAGPAAVIHRGGLSFLDVWQEALLTAACSARWATLNGVSAFDGYPAPTVISTDLAVPDDSVWRGFCDRAMRCIADPDWRKYAVGQVLCFKSPEATFLGNGLNRAMREQSTVIFVAAGEQCFGSGSVEVVARQMLASTFGDGAIYWADQKPKRSRRSKLEAMK